MVGSCEWRGACKARGVVLGRQDVPRVWSLQSRCQERVARARLHHRTPGGQGRGGGSWREVGAPMPDGDAGLALVERGRESLQRLRQACRPATSVLSGSCSGDGLARWPWAGSQRGRCGSVRTGMGVLGGGACGTAVSALAIAGTPPAACLLGTSALTQEPGCVAAVSWGE